MVERKEGGICKGTKKQGKASPGFVCYCFLNPVLKQDQHMCLVGKILLKTKNKKTRKRKVIFTKFKNQRRISLAMLQK